MSTALYLRVSSAQQTTACQRPDIDRIVALRGLTVTQVYEEQESAAKHRPEFERMMADARAKKFTTLVIWALDRFGRNMAGVVRDMDELQKTGVNIISVKEPWMDTSGPTRDLLVAIFGWAAQLERSRLIERTKAGMAVARMKGKKFGRRSRKLIPEDQRPAVIQSWRSSGQGYRALAQQLGGVSPMTARKLAMGA